MPHSRHFPYLPPIGYSGDAIFQIFGELLYPNHVELFLVGYGILRTLYFSKDSGIRKHVGILSR